MRKLAQYVIVAAIMILVFPIAALAHNSRGDDKDNNRGRGNSNHFGLETDQPIRFDEKFTHARDNFRGNLRGGTVTATANGSFTMEARNGTVYTVNTTDATFSLPFKGTFSAADLEVDDSVKVKGPVSDTTINADAVIVVPANTRPAKAKGTVTAVNGNKITVQTKHNGEVTLNTDSDTTVTDRDGNEIATADIEVGSEIKAKGLWDKVKETFHAIAIKLHLK